jgi:serine-type D-Ala-D-Ala carboxypeptidase/endopeptidase (penicillin-binding protein 4)
MKKTFLILLLSALIFSCKTAQNISQSTNRQSFINTMIDSSAVLKNSFTGVALYDPTAKKMLFERNADHYFTPASNTKLFTLFASLKTLGDSIPTLRYVKRGDSLIFWGTGDPTVLHPSFQNDAAIRFLKNRKEKLYYSNANFTMPHFGLGWSWDDFNDAYLPELSGLPLYGNIVHFSVKEKVASVSSKIFSSTFRQKQSSEDFVQRIQHDNQFSVPNTLLESADYEQNIPFKTSTELSQQLLMDTLKRNISLVKMAIPADAKTLFGIKADTVYKKMMQDSDNMLAEHLMLLCGSVLKDSLNTSFAIQSTIDKHLSALPDAPKWVDGSGLSRYNLFTPRTMVALCEALAQTRNQDELFGILATGGKSGTLKGQYKAEKPFVFAKSGTLSGVYNLSGFVLTKSGKTLIFSLMYNNFTHGASKIRKETEKILRQIHEQN